MAEEKMKTTVEYRGNVAELRPGDLDNPVFRQLAEDEDVVKHVLGPEERAKREALLEELLRVIRERLQLMDAKRTYNKSVNETLAELDERIDKISDRIRTLDKPGPLFDQEKTRVEDLSGPEGG